MIDQGGTERGGGTEQGRGVPRTSRSVIEGVDERMDVDDQAAGGWGVRG